MSATRIMLWTFVAIVAALWLIANTLNFVGNLRAG